MQSCKQYMSCMQPVSNDHFSNMMHTHVTDPDWVSCNLAIFICEQCSYIHQNLGSRFSKLKRVNDKNWTDEQMQVSVHYLCVVNIGLVLGLCDLCCGYFFQFQFLFFNFSVSIIVIVNGINGMHPFSLPLT